MYANLITAMKIEGIEADDLTKLWGCHRNTAHSWMNGETPLPLEKALSAWQKLFVRYDFQWLFRKTHIGKIA